MFTDVVLNFVYGSNRKHLTSSLKLKETIFDVRCVQVIEFSPTISTPLFVSLDSAQCEGNSYYDHMIGLSFGGSGHDFPKIKMVRREIKEVFCNMRIFLKYLSTNRRRTTQGFILGYSTDFRKEK